MTSILKHARNTRTCKFKIRSEEIPNSDGIDSIVLIYAKIHYSAKKLRTPRKF